MAKYIQIECENNLQILRQYLTEQDSKTALWYPPMYQVDL